MISGVGANKRLAIRAALPFPRRLRVGTLAGIPWPASCGPGGREIIVEALGMDMRSGSRPARLVKRRLWAAVEATRSDASAPDRSTMDWSCGGGWVVKAGSAMSGRENETPRGSLGWQQGDIVMDGCKRVPADDGSRCGPGIGIPAYPTRPEMTACRLWLVLSSGRSCSDARAAPCRLERHGGRGRVEMAASRARGYAYVATSDGEPWQDGRVEGTQRAWCAKPKETVWQLGASSESRGGQRGPSWEIFHQRKALSGGRPCT